MSYDLAVWHTEEPLTDEKAAGIYLRLCEDWPYLHGDHPAISAFYEELTARWPEIDTVPEHQIGNFDFCPWSCALSHSGMAVVMACVWPKAVEVAQFVQPLARKHGLLLFNPQSSRAALPDRLQPKRPGLLQRLLRRTH